MNDSMLSYHGDKAIKAKYISRVRAHRTADELVQGATGQNGKGCAVWCTLDAYEHSRYPIELGVPQVIARLEDSIFEGLPNEEAMAWPERFLDAIPVGRDLSMVWPKFASWMLRDLEVKFSEESPRSAVVCGNVAALYDRWIEGNKPSIKGWKPARASDSAVAYAAYAADAADSAAAYASRVAYAAAYAAYAADAYDASDSAAYAAYAAAYASDSYDAAIAFWRSAADKLESILRSS